MINEIKILFFAALLVITGTACKSDKEDRKKIAEVSTNEQADSYHYSYSFKMNQPGSDDLVSSGSSEMYLSEKALRSETKLEVMGQKTDMVMLVKADEPNKVIMLHDKSKTYSIFNPDDLKLGGEMAEKMKEMSNDSISVVGKEKMNGYECTHLKIITTANVPESIKQIVGQDSSVEEYWVSKEIPGSSMFDSWAKSQPKMMRGMNSEIYEYGIPVKMVSKEGDAINMVMELTEAKEQNRDKDLFEIPPGYTIKE
ncbi:protein of unknown function [Salegentibacter echinorum]|uniref:DUF4412 domain-containing protein n=1 Tax=Salegentibacter echinorum TaxID=1073325 RepID=A0A1M5CSK9_SALEC|nr:DUF4412 domain-containing protein [Salegentibacter echinorum]SHF57725.1 protein of unknown function [Salegentibacter echinorum]